MTTLRDLAPWSEDHDFVSKFQAVKRACKVKLAAWVKERTGFVIPVDAMYDVMVKRMHEYKRQLMNILYIIYRYQSIKETPAHER